ncbi:MAG: ABC transporter permease, partial [Pseudomonadota bacterium]
MAADSTADATQDERIKEESLFTRLMKRPELGAIAGVILVTIFFLITADSAMFTLAGVMNFMSPAAQLGILAIGAALLMIGGEFDLSVGSMVAFTGLFFGACVVTFSVPLLLAIPATLIFAAVVGNMNGQIVLRTGLPSFIVTLAFLFILRGLSLVGLKWATGGSTQLRGVREAVEGDWLAPIFSGDAFPALFAAMANAGLIDTFNNGRPKVQGIPVEILWFVVIALLASYVLTRT